MACMENHCKQCGNEWADNEIKTVCPSCGALERENGRRIITRHYDEVPDGLIDRGDECDT